jgi:transposase
MKAKNKYYKMTHISERKFREILKYFCEDLTATKASIFSGISRNSINIMYGKLRERIAHESIRNTPELGEFEVDESYFGAKRVRGKRGRGAAGKTPVFGILKRGGNVYVNCVQHCSREQLMPIIQGKALEGSTIHSDGWKAYDGLIINGYTHYRVHHSENEFVRGKSHVNGIESFWSYAKRRLSKFNGLSDTTFTLHLKECEFRWNYRNQNIYVILLSLLRKNPL